MPLADQSLLRPPYSDAYVPGWFGRLVIAVSLLALVVVQLLSRLQEPPFPLNDPAISNILTLIFSFSALLAVWIWFCFFSAYGKRAQRIVLVLPAVLIGLVLLILRPVGFSGSMVPRFVPRWSAGHNPVLGDADLRPASQKTDLLTTTPQDFPQFLGPDRSVWIAGPPLARDWKEQPPKLLWKRPIGAGWSGFAAVNGYAVTLEQRGEEEWITCYEIATGAPAWVHATKARHENPLGGLGPRSTPTIYRGRVYTLGETRP